MIVVAQTGSYVLILRFGLKTVSTEDDVRDAFPRDSSGPLAEEGKRYMTEQVKVLNDDEPGVFRGKPVYSFL